jgi:hypothetical protein
MKKMIVFVLMVFLLSSCVSTRDYRAFWRGLEDDWKSIQDEAKSNKTHVNPVWRNPHAFPR